MGLNKDQRQELVRQANELYEDRYRWTLYFLVTLFGGGLLFATLLPEFLSVYHTAVGLVFLYGLWKEIQYRRKQSYAKIQLAGTEEADQLWGR